jgi:hypothetical protein
MGKMILGKGALTGCADNDIRSVPQLSTSAAPNSIRAEAKIPLFQQDAVTDMSRLHFCPFRSKVDEQ